MTEAQKEAITATYSKNRRDKTEKYKSVFFGHFLMPIEAPRVSRSHTYASKHGRRRIIIGEMPTRPDGRPLSELGWRLHTAITGFTEEDYIEAEKSCKKLTISQPRPAEELQEKLQKTYKKVTLKFGRDENSLYLYNSKTNQNNNF